MSDIHDGAVRTPVGENSSGPDQEPRYLLDGPLRRAQANALQWALHQGIEPFQRERQVCAPLVAGHRMDFVDDHGLRAPQELTAPLGCEQDVERLRGGDQNVGRLAEHQLACPRRGIAGAHSEADLRKREPLGLGQPHDPSQRFLQVLLDVISQRLERRDVDHPCAVP